MDRSYWQTRWNEGRIAFHQPSPNPTLVRYMERASGGGASRVLVPLCGKSRDMVTLADQGCSVVGVEAVELAVEAFFRENEMAPARTTLGETTRYEAGPFTLFAGDFFAISRADVGDVSWAYDRAALYAMPPRTRDAYAKHLLELLPVGGRVLLLTFGYDQSKMEGPPFSVGRSDVERLFGDTCVVELLEAREIIAESPRFQARGLDSIEEAAFLLTKR